MKKKALMLKAVARKSTNFGNSSENKLSPLKKYSQFYGAKSGLMQQ